MSARTFKSFLILACLLSAFACSKGSKNNNAAVIPDDSAQTPDQAGRKPAQVVSPVGPVRIGCNLGEVDLCVDAVFDSEVAETIKNECVKELGGDIISNGCSSDNKAANGHCLVVDEESDKKIRVHYYNPGYKEETAKTSCLDESQGTWID
jgi:hypothetical protein